MTILSGIRSLEELLVAASLPDEALTWLQKPLALHDLKLLTVRKSSDGYRTVAEPLDASLIRLQKKLKEFLDRQVLEPHPDVHGFTRDRGSYSNATAHLNAAALLTVDISDFFSSISSAEINATLVDLGAVPEVAIGITNISTFRNALATGFSTSPVLSNLYFRPTDVQLSNLAADLNLTYTRYADDLTFSGDEVNDEHLEAVTEILALQNLQVNKKKVRFQRKGHPQNVTGFVVAHADHPRVPRYFKKQIRQDLYFIKKFGVEQQARVRGVSEDKLEQRLLGRINYLMCSEKKLANRMKEELEELVGDEGED
ncbi:reverse transcriptase family protein [Arthrobacter sp. TmT3-37]